MSEILKSVKVIHAVLVDGQNTTQVGSRHAGDIVFEEGRIKITSKKGKKISFGLANVAFMEHMDEKQEAAPAKKSK